MTSKLSCQVVLVATETPDVVDLGDVIGFLQAQHQNTQKRGTLIAGAPQAPSPAAGAGGKLAKKDSVVGGSPLSPLTNGPPPTLVFERAGLGGDPQSPLPLDGAEFTAAVLQALHRLAEKRTAADCSHADGTVDPLVVVVGCPSMDLVHALANTMQPMHHDVRMLITITSMEPFPAAPSATLAKGAKKPVDPKKGAKGGKGAAGDKTGSPSTTVRIESGMRKMDRCKGSVKFLRFHLPTAAATEGIVTQSILPELTALEASLAGFSRWYAEKDLLPVPCATGSALNLVAHAKHLADVAHTTHPRAIGDVGSASEEDTSTNVWKLETAMTGILSQTVLNAEAQHNPLRNVQLIDTAALERLRASEAAAAAAVATEAPEQPGDDTPPALEEEKGHAALPRKGPPMFVQHRPDVEPSSPDQVQWLVRQFVKKSIGKLLPDSEASRELARLLRGAAATPGLDVPNTASAHDSWTADAVQRRTDVVDAAIADSPKVPSTRPIPVGVQLLRRAAAAGGSTLSADLPASIDKDLVAAMERSHTQREIQRGLAMTMLEQVAREEFPNLVKARFQLQPYVYSEAMTTPAMTNRLSQFMQRYGSNVVKVVRVRVDDPDNVNALASAVSTAAQLSKVPTPHEVIVAGVHIPADNAAKRSIVTASLGAVSGAPSFAQYVDWSSRVAHPPSDATHEHHSTTRDVLTSSMVKPSTVKDVMQQCAFFQPTGHNGGHESVLAHEGRWTIFPYDSSVVDVIRDTVNNTACHTVRHAKDDVVCTLKARGTLDSLQFCATLDDGTVMTIAPRHLAQHEQRVPSPALSGTPDSPGNSRAASSHRASRLGTAQTVGQGTVLSRMSSADAAPALDSIVVDDGFDAAGNAAATPTGDAPQAPPSVAIRVIPTFDVTVSYGDMTLSADEQDSNIMFRFTNQGIREAVVEGTIDGETVQSFAEFEVARHVLHNSGCVVRHFASGSVQSLQADGSLATLVRRNDTHPQPFWLITSASGEQFVKGAFPGAPPTTKLDTYFCDVRQSVDRENDCDVFSRADGVVMVFYRTHGAAASTGRTLQGGNRTYHTRVVVHADGTYVVSRLDGSASLDNKVVPPALDGLFRQFEALSSIGTVSFVVETPTCPRVFLFSLRGTATDTTNESSMLPTLQREFLIQFGDGSVLKRQSVLRFQGAGDSDIRPAGGGPASSRFLETTFCKAGETTLRFHHDTALAFVEPHSIHLSPLTTTSIALCEGVGVFDLALGGFRLVDFRAHVTTVSDLMDMDRFPTVHAVRESNETQLLLSMAPIGYAPHVLPKRHRDELDKSKENAQREQFEKSRNGQTIPPLTDRLRELTSQYIVEHRLISKGARRKHPGELGITAAGAASYGTTRAAANSMQGGSQGSKDLMASTLALMHTADIDTAAPIPANESPTHFAPFLTEVRPLLFVRYPDGTVTELLCVQDVASFVQNVQMAPRTVTVSRTYCSGEPGVEQLTFVGSEVAAFGAKAKRVSVDASPLQGGGASWIPRTMLPPRRMVTHSAKAVAEASARQQVRTLLKFQPLSVSARLVASRQEVRRQDQLLAMHNYNASIQNAICVVAPAELHAQATLRAKYLHQRGGAASTTTTATPPPPPPGPACFVEPALTSQQPFDMPYAEEMDTAAPVNGGAERASHAAPQRPSLSPLNVVSFRPKAADFGPVIAGLRYAYPVVLHSHTTDTLLFEVFRPKRTANGIQMVSVQTSSFMVSPLGESTIYAMLNLPDEALDVLPVDPADAAGMQRLVSESIRMECAQLKAKFEISISAVVRPSLAAAKLKLDSTTAAASTVHAPRKPKVDTRQAPLSSHQLHESGYFGDLAIDTSIRVVGQAV